MRKLRSLGVLLPLLFLIGASHCEEGDRLAFGRARVIVPLAAATRHITSITIDRRLSFAAYSNGLVQISRDEEGRELSRSVQLQTPEVLSFHQDLVAAGGLDLVGTLENSGAISSIGHATIITVFEPWREGTAWASTFSFGTRPLDPRATAVWDVIDAFVETHFPGGFSG